MVFRVPCNWVRFLGFRVCLYCHSAETYGSSLETWNSLCYDAPVHLEMPITWDFNFSCSQKDHVVRRQDSNGGRQILVSRLFMRLMRLAWIKSLFILQHSACIGLPWKSTWKWKSCLWDMVIFSADKLFSSHFVNLKFSYYMKLTINDHLHSFMVSHQMLVIYQF